MKTKNLNLRCCVCDSVSSEEILSENNHVSSGNYYRDKRDDTKVYCDECFNAIFGDEDDGT